MARRVNTWADDWDYWTGRKWECPECDERTEPYEDSIYCRDCNERMGRL